MSDVEEWRPVVGFEGIYEVSSHGRVRSLPRVGPGGNVLRGKILEQSIAKGYRFVGLRNNSGAFKAPRIHALVARAFIGERPRGKVVNHIDFNRANNHHKNLEYITHKQNIQHSAREARMGLLTKDEVQSIRSLVSRDPAFNLDLLAAKLGVDIHLVRGVVACKNYTLVPNKDGSAPIPLLSVHGKTMGIEDIADLQALGFTIPEIGQYYHVEYSAPYQALRRAGVWQVNSKSSTRGSGRRMAKSKIAQAGD